MKRSTSTAILVGLVLLGVANRGAKRGARPSTWKRWTDYEATSFVDAMLPTGVPIQALLNVYAAESGLDPHASSGIAWGLCQAIESTLKSVGWFKDHKKAAEFGALSVDRQAPWIALILASQIRAIGFTPKSALDLYVANFSPLAARSRADVLYRAPSKAYEANRGLDRAKKGYIDRADLTNALERARASVPYLETMAQVERLTAAKKVS